MPWAGNMIKKLEKKLLHYMSKAIADFNMIEKGDRVMVCVSGGKDSYTLLKLLSLYRIHKKCSFEIFSYTLDQSQPGWNDDAMRQWMVDNRIEFEIEKRDTYSVVMDKVPEGKTYCSLCSRLRRGNIYRYAEDNGYTKVALGHHRDDLTQTLLMSILYSGQVRSMPPKLLTDNKKHIVVRPLVYCQESDIREYAKAQKFPLIPCNLCGSQSNLKRQKIKKLLAELTDDNEKVPSNILHALQSIQPSQLMDKKLWDFKGLSVDALQEDEVCLSEQ
jgi:tRNA 2-thiocytidine biosynthesis protein TtcA